MSVIYLQFKSEFEARPGAKVHLSDIARVSPSDDEIAALEFDIPKRGRSVDAVELAARVSEVRPRARIELLGAGGIFVSRPRPRRGLSAFLIKALLVLFLFGGAAMGITFFHADVNMLDAQQALVSALGGGELTPMELAIPYSIGVFVGIGAFFLLGGKSKSPLALKLRDYRKQLEQADLGDKGE